MNVQRELVLEPFAQQIQQVQRSQAKAHVVKKKKPFVKPAVPRFKKEIAPVPQVFAPSEPYGAFKNDRAPEAQFAIPSWLEDPIIPLGTSQKSPQNTTWSTSSPTPLSQKTVFDPFQPVSLTHSQSTPTNIWSSGFNEVWG